MFYAINMDAWQEKGFAITRVFLYKWFTILKKLLLPSNSLISLLLQKDPAILYRGRE